MVTDCPADGNNEKGAVTTRCSGVLCSQVLILPHWRLKNQLKTASPSNDGVKDCQATHPELRSVGLYVTFIKFLLSLLSSTNFKTLFHVTLFSRSAAFAAEQTGVELSE